MGLGGAAVGHCTLAGTKGVKIALYTGGVDEKASVNAPDVKQLIGVGDKATAAEALICSGPISTDFNCRRIQVEHCQSHYEVGWIAGTITNFT